MYGVEIIKLVKSSKENIGDESKWSILPHLMPSMAQIVVIVLTNVVFIEILL